MTLKTILVTIALAASFAPAAAEARPDTRSMTCQQLLGFLKSKGSVVMDTGPRTYKLFVWHRGYCQYGETVGTAWVDASDGKCRLRECKPPRIDRGGFR